MKEEVHNEVVSAMGDRKRNWHRKDTPTAHHVGMSTSGLPDPFHSQLMISLEPE